MNKIIKIFLLTVLLFVICISVYNYFQSPMYTLKSIKNAVENRDWKKFNRFVDLESIYSTVVNKTISETDNELVGGIVGIVAPKIKDVFIEQIQLAIEGGTFDNSVLSILSKNNSLSKLKTINKGKLVELTVFITPKYIDKDIPVKLVFRKEFLYSKLINVDIKKIEEVNKLFENLVYEDYLLSVQDSISNMVSVECVNKYIGCADWVYRYCMEDLLMIVTKITNKTDLDIKEILLEIYPDKSWDNSENMKISIANNIKAKQYKIIDKTKGWKYNEFDKEDIAFKKSSPVEIYYKIKYIIFVGGKSLFVRDKSKYLEECENKKFSLEDIISRRKQYGINDSLEIYNKLFN